MMRVQVVDGMTKILRFPVKFREPPSMFVVRQLRLDRRELFMRAAGFGFAVPPINLRGHTDRATGAHNDAHPACP